MLLFELFASGELHRRSFVEFLESLTLFLQLSLVVPEFGHGELLLFNFQLQTFFVCLYCVQLVLQSIQITLWPGKSLCISFVNTNTVLSLLLLPVIFFDDFLEFFVYVFALINGLLSGVNSFVQFFLEYIDFRHRIVPFDLQFLLKKKINFVLKS